MAYDWPKTVSEMGVLKGEGRLTLILDEVDSGVNGFSQDVEAGLTNSPKRLSCRFFYDSVGSRLFEEICKVPEYYLTRAEREILEKKAEEIASVFPLPISLVEFGSGSAAKTRLLIEAFLERHGRLQFVPVDISRIMLEESSASLLGAYPDLEILGIVGEYQAGLQRLKDKSRGPRLILWLGSSIGNLHRPDALRFLSVVRKTMTEGDRMLLGIDLRKDPKLLEAAYDDSQGLSARFNLNLLGRINRELGGQFHLKNFRHRAEYHQDDGRIDMHLASICDQQITIEDLGLEISFTKDETIHTESAYKYSEAEIEAMADGAGLALERQWFDSERRFSLNLLEKQ